MKLWIIDDSNKTASAVLEPQETATLTSIINRQLRVNTYADGYEPHARNIALKLEKLGLQIEGL